MGTRTRAGRNDGCKANQGWKGSQSFKSPSDKAFHRSFQLARQYEAQAHIAQA